MCASTSNKLPVVTFTNLQKKLYNHIALVYFIQLSKLVTLFRIYPQKVNPACQIKRINTILYIGRKAYRPKCLPSRIVFGNKTIGSIGGKNRDTISGIRVKIQVIGKAATHRYISVIISG